MTIDWKTFSERVPAGTMVRFQYDEWSDLREGILLENYPHHTEARIAEIDTEEWMMFAKDLREHNPTLRFQGYTERGWDNFGVKQAEYLIDGTWVSFEELMT